MTDEIDPLRPGPWAEFGACAGLPPDAFDCTVREGERRNDRRMRLRVDDAVDVCRTCVVSAECRRWAMSSPDPVPGFVAGGLTYGERQRERSRRRRARRLEDGS